MTDTKGFGDARDWFLQKRFGMFVHWGLYAIEGWHEQDQWRRKIPRAEYGKLAERFNPVRFDPEAWLDLAAEAGMEYLCLTTKHHDGFCLWDTKQTDFNIMHTPYGRDVVGMLASACRRRGVPLCLYYSVADWHHPNYPNQGRSHELPPQPGDRPDLAAYVAFVKEQIRELCSNYGPIHGIWWDMNTAQAQDESIHAMIRQLQPAAVINNRGFGEGDFATPERESLAGEAAPFETLVEACQSVGQQSWGYRVGEDYYTDRALIRSIDAYLARGGHYLLNIGPMGDGTIPARVEGILRRIGRWYHKVREAFTGECIPGLLDWRHLPVTRRGDTLYVHLTDLDACGLSLRPLAAQPRTATLLNDGRPVDARVELLPWYHREGTPCLHLCDLPTNEFGDETMVVKLEFDRLVL